MVVLEESADMVDSHCLFFSHGLTGSLIFDFFFATIGSLALCSLWLALPLKNDLDYSGQNRSLVI